jgi:putative ABC transport system permease protein
MLKNYLKTAIRNLLKEKTSSLINIAGLSLGITSCIILFLILKDGASYDKYHTNYNRIFRVVSKSKDNGNDTFTQGIPTALPEGFKNDFREAEEVVFTSYRRNSMIAVEQTDGTFKKYEEPTGLVITQPSFFRIFDRKIIIGDAQKGLDDPNEAIISRKWALRYFGSVEAVGKLVRYEDDDYKITSVMDDYPPTTDLPFDLMLSYSTKKRHFETEWESVSDADNCYFLLKEGESIDGVRSQIPAFRKKYLGDDDAAGEKTFILQPLKEVHTDTRFGNYNKRMPPAAKISFTVIGVFLMIMACINFINLTTAEAVKRTREVGVRKVMGSSQLQLVIKFVGETFMITFIAVLVSLCLTELALGSVNSFLDLSLSLDLDDSYVWLFLILLMALVSILSGLYPAIVTASFKPTEVLKGQLRATSRSGFNLRRGMVAIQFFISQLFIICAIVLVRQMDFMEQQYPGFRKDAIITVPIPVREEARSPVSRMRTLKNEILMLEGVEEASLSNFPPSSPAVVSTGFKVLEKNEELSTQVKLVDGDFISLFDIELLAGEPLSDLDTMAGFVVNEKFVRTAGYENNEAIIGKVIELWGKQLPVKGVVRDYNTQSLENPIKPVIMFNHRRDYGNLSIRLKPVNLQASILSIKKQWEAAYPEHIFNYTFMDQQISNLYRGERKINSLITVFAFIAVFIGCLGLFGLISFMANQKSKEIGIRKVLGASVGNIVVLFSGEFSKLIVIAFVLATPLSAFFLDKILQEFAYRIQLGPFIFLASLAITFFIATVTVGLRAFRAASINPVKSLRSE